MYEKDTQVQVRANEPAPLQVLSDDELAACAGGDSSGEVAPFNPPGRDNPRVAD